jgi:serpin B
VLVLADAVYLKAAWINQFSDAMTHDGTFHTATRGPVIAPLMRQHLHNVAYTARDGWQRVTLPYAGAHLTMRIVVPTARVAAINELTTALAAATAPAPGDPRCWVDLTLPRWNTGTTIALVPALRRLGVSDLFDPRADISGIAPGLFVSDALQRAVITVTEYGTEAAAITGVAVTTSGVSGAPIPMLADRPFAWAIVHEPTGTPVYTGHVIDPTAA